VNAKNSALGKGVGMKNAGRWNREFFTVLITAVFIWIFSGCSGGGSGGSDSDLGGGDGNASAETCNPMDGQTIELRSGWSEPVPTALDTTDYSLTDLQQPGSRIYYISTSGDDSTAEIYFWDGTQIVDSSGSSTGVGGVAYGTDPMHPTGPIRPFARWSYVGPRRAGWGSIEIGEPWDGTSYQAPGADRSITRYEYPDWWLFKRGDTFDLFDDYLSFAQETNPAFTAEDLLSASTGGLNIPGGRSATEKQIMGAYGDTADPRPRFKNPASGSFISNLGRIEPKHMTYLSLHLDGRGDDKGNGEPLRGGGMSFLGQSTAAVDILFEDCRIEGTSGSAIQNTSGQFTFYRCVVADNWKDDGTHLQGLYYSGNRDARLVIQECIFMRNGFTDGDPAVTGWPPSGAQRYDIFNRNFYLSGETNNMKSGVVDTISIIGASGDQFRPGMRIERNFFYQGYVFMGAHGGYADSCGATGTMVDNVLQRFKGSNTDDNRGHPGWGLFLTSGAYDVEVANNIVTGAQHEGFSFAFSLRALDWYCYCHTFNYATRYNAIHDNIFEANYRAVVGAVDGVDEDNADCANWSYPGIVGNSISDNILINTHPDYQGISWLNNPDDTADDTTNDTSLSGNTLYSSRAAAAADLGWTDPDRTLRSYLVSLGYTVTSDDGYMEFFNAARDQRKGNWNADLTSRAIVNYFRAGYNMTLLP
jgi:hypothetical protein